MPEFILDLGEPVAARQYNALDEFTQGYIEAMFFTSTGPDDEGLEHATFAELAPSALHDIVTDCTAFQNTWRAEIDEAVDYGRINGYDEKAAGRDFWYSRNGHGTGFWDRGQGDISDKLHKAAQVWRGRDVYRGDDELIYLA